MCLCCTENALTLLRGRGWQRGMREEVCLAPRMPASWAAGITSPFCSLLVATSCKAQVCVGTRHSCFCLWPARLLATQDAAKEAAQAVELSCKRQWLLFCTACFSATVVAEPVSDGLEGSCGRLLHQAARVQLPLQCAVWQLAVSEAPSVLVRYAFAMCKAAAKPVSVSLPGRLQRPATRAQTLWQSALWQACPPHPPSLRAPESQRASSACAQSSCPYSIHSQLSAHHSASQNKGWRPQSPIWLAPGSPRGQAHAPCRPVPVAQ